MTEEEFADRLTADQERSHQGWNLSAKVTTCRDSLMSDVLNVSEARRIYGPKVVSQALRQIEESLDESNIDKDAAVIAIARVVEPKERFKKTDYAYFDGGQSHGYAVAASVAVALFVGVIFGSWVEPADAVARLFPDSSVVARYLERPVEVNSDMPKLTSGSPPLKFSVPDNKQTEDKLQSEVQSAAAKPIKSPEKLQAEIANLREELQNRIIVLEAQRRILAKMQGQTSDASDALDNSHSLSMPARYEIDARATR